MFLSQKGAKHVSQYPNNPDYEFKVINKSILEGLFLSDFWEYITEKFIPPWIVPNMLTLSGWGMMLICWIIMGFAYYPQRMADAGWIETFHPTGTQWYDSLMITIRSEYMFLIAAIIFFLYQTVDGCDGKQARKTKQCSPLGEILDHGVDANSMTIFMVNVLLIFNKTPIDHETLKNTFSPYLFFVSYVFPIGMSMAFYIAHVNHYHTSVFIMDEISATDIETFIIILNIIRYVTGNLLLKELPIIPSLIPNSIKATVGLPEDYIINFGDVVIIVLSIGGAISIITLLFKSLRNTKRTQSPLLQMIPSVAYTIMLLYYAAQHYQETWFITHYATFLTCAMFSFSIILFSLIVSRASIDNMHFEGLIAGVIVPLTLLLARDVFFAQVIEAATMLQFVTMYITMFYCIMGSSIIGSFCGALQINFLRRSVSKEKL